MIIGLDIESKKLICSCCNKPVDGKYYRFDLHRKIYCDSCYNLRHRCDLCDLPTYDYFPKNNHILCDECYIISDFCKCCGKEIKNPKDYNVIKNVSGYFCFECFSTNPKCTRCKSPIHEDKDLTKIDDGLFLCPNCMSVSITDIEVANNVLINIAKICRKKLGFEVPNDVPLHLATRKEIKMLKNQVDPKSIYLPSGITITRNKISSIYVLKGLSLSKFISILTKEYTQIWMVKNNLVESSSAVREGFANWVSTKLLYILGYQKEIEDIESGISQNGFVLSKIRSLENSRGFRGLMDFLIK